MSRIAHPLYFIGAGPGDPELITVKAQRILCEADAVLYAGSLVPQDILTWCRPEAETVDSASLTLEQTHAFLRDRLQSGLLVARVHTGDPSLYGAIREQIHLLEEEGLPYEIVPGITAAFAAAARAGVSYTLPERTQSLILTRAEGRTPVPEKEALSSLATHDTAMAIYLSAGSAGAMQRQLLNGGYAANTPVVIAYRVGWPEERILFVRLEEMAETAERENITRQALFLILPGQEDEPVFSRLYSPDFTHGYRESGSGSQDPGAPMSIVNRIAVYALTRPAARLAAHLAKALNQARILEEGAHKGKLGSEIREPGTESVQRRTDNAERTTLNGERGTSTTDLYLPASLTQEFGGQGFSRLQNLVAETFHRYTGHVFLTAAGITVRGIAPLLQGKEKDPAVVVLDQKGEYAVSLLSGHLGGGNSLAREVAEILGGRAVITTATDSLGLPAVEELARNAEMRIKDIRAATPVNAALANQRILQLHDPGERLGLVAALGPEFPLRRIEAVEELDPDHAAIWVDWHRAMQAVNYGALVLHPLCLVAGVGCNRGTDEEEILQLIHSVFHEFDLALESLACLATTSVKREEVGLIRAAEALEVPLLCFEAEELEAVSVPNPSETVSKHMGVASVCEAAALHQARTTTLLLPKRKSANATLALALAGSPQSASARGEKST